MIQSFADKITAAIFAGLEVRRLPKAIQSVARRKLKLIDAAVSLEGLRVPPGNRLEALKGDRAGQWSIRITISGGFAFGGRARRLLTWKWSITTRSSA